MTESFADLIACEDALMFVNAAITSTGQREFRFRAGEQRLSLDFLHDYMLENYRDVYAATLALDINDHNAAMIVRNLLVRAAAAGTAERRRREGRLIARRLESLPQQRVYRLFRELRRAGVNNRRTRAIIRDWMAARRDPAFDAVKYRGAVKDAVRHAHLPVNGELGAFLFAPHRVRSFRTPIFETWRLSESQIRRGHLLTQLAEHDWSLEATASAMGTDGAALALRLERAGFGYLLRQDVLDHYRAQARRGRAVQKE